MSEAMLKALSAPFPGPAVHWRAQGKPFKRGDGQYFARVVAYVDARDVMDRLDEVCGLNWQSKTTETAKGRVMCSIGIKLGDGSEVWRDDGAGDTAIEGEKGAISDAFKRAAVRFGIGRYLYALPSPAVEVDCDERDGKVYLKGLTRESRDKLAALAHKSVERWEADLRAMDRAEAEEPKPAPEPKRETKAEAPREEPKPKEPAQAPARARGGDAPAEKIKGRHFEAPSFKKSATKDERSSEWTMWIKQPMASVKASASRAEALAHIEAVASELDLLRKDTGKDGRVHLMAAVNRRWPVEAPKEEAPKQEASGDPMAIPLPEPETKKSLDMWAGKVSDLIEKRAESPAEVEKILAVNAEGLKRASAALEMDIPEMIRGEWEKAQQKGASR